MNASVISIGCEGGGPETAPVCRLKVPLYRALCKHVTSSHSDAVESFGVVLRVGGKLASYGEEGIAKLRFSKSSRSITVDIQVPEAVWQPKTTAELKSYLAGQVGKALELCIARLRKDKCEIDGEALMVQVRSAAHEYLSATNDG